MLLVLRALAAVAGNQVDVTCLDVGNGIPAELSTFASVRRVPLPPTQHVYDSSARAAISFRVLEWLREQRAFEYLIFDAAEGASYYALLARELELSLALRAALQSVRAQRGVAAQRVQVVLVDDGSVTAAAHAALQAAATWAEFQTGRWLLLHRSARYLGAARNAAARHAQGRFLFFLDDDNCLKPHALATLVRAADASHAHVLTMVNEKWPHESAPPASGDDPRTERWLPLGDAATVGLFRNCFGDASALVRRATFESLGGFTEDENVGHEDWELWARAVLSGYQLRLVPEALYWYRIGGGGMLSESLGGDLQARAQRYANYARNLRPYVERLRGWPEAQDLVRLAQGVYVNGGANA